LTEEHLKDKLAGKFIVLDGPDGCGKSTQVKLLAGWLGGCGVDVVCLRDPGGTVIGEKVRRILLNPRHTAMDVRAELLLYMAARAQLWQEKIAPALAAGKCVIVDRWLSSSCAYQGWAAGLGVENVIKIAQQSLERIWPDLTIILDVGPKTAAGRLRGSRDRMERKGAGYHAKVRDGFLRLCRYNNRIIIIDGAADREAVHEKVKRAVLSVEL
jgi:dTMP kinase